MGFQFAQAFMEFSVFGREVADFQPQEEALLLKHRPSKRQQCFVAIERAPRNRVKLVKSSSVVQQRKVEMGKFVQQHEQNRGW